MEEKLNLFVNRKILTAQVILNDRKMLSLIVFKKQI